ncbi:MAG: LVIVD repeat-containing protein [Gemmatimonadales bacterium]
MRASSSLCLAVSLIAVLACGDNATTPPPGSTVNGRVIITGPTAIVQGDVVQFQAEVQDDRGNVVPSAQMMWSLEPTTAGLVSQTGKFVGYRPGSARVVVAADGASSAANIEIGARGLNPGALQLLGRGSVTDRFTSDIWVHGNYAYTGTWSTRSANGVPRSGNLLYVWDVSNAAQPSRTDSIAVDARTVNDVKVRADGLIGVITHEGSSDGTNGITLLDLTDPAHPTVLSRFTSSLEFGVHNAWIDGNYVYAVADGSAGGLRVVDITDPLNPDLVAQFFGGASFLHDVYVRDGLAVLSHWDAGLIILDVGSGIAGGAPANPVEVSRVATAGGQTHNTWYWPAGGYIFVGEEDFQTPGMMHVVDVSDLRNPREVASFAVADHPPHNFWLDEAKAILYMAWYENGLRALDVSGVLFGRLDLQGRQITAGIYGTGNGGCVSAAGAPTCTWAPQLHNGLVFVSDMNSGLWIFQPSF